MQSFNTDLLPPECLRGSAVGPTDQDVLWRTQRSQVQPCEAIHEHA